MANTTMVKPGREGYKILFSENTVIMNQTQRRGDSTERRQQIQITKENNTMSTIEITSKIEALKELEALIEEAKAEAEALRDEIKTEMLNRNTEEMEAGQYIVRWTPVLSQRFDSTAFKKVMPDIYKSFTKQVSSRRFSIA